MNLEHALKIEKKIHYIGLNSDETSPQAMCQEELCVCVGIYQPLAWIQTKLAVSSQAIPQSGCTLGNTELNKYLNIALSAFLWYQFSQIPMQILFRN